MDILADGVAKVAGLVVVVAVVVVVVVDIVLETVTVLAYIIVI